MVSKDALERSRISHDMWLSASASDTIRGVAEYEERMGTITLERADDLIAAVQRKLDRHADHAGTHESLYGWLEENKAAIQTIKDGLKVG